MSDTPQQPYEPPVPSGSQGYVGPPAQPGMTPAPQWAQQQPAPPQGRPYDARPTAPRNGLGVAALILGIAALLTFWSIVGGIVLGLIAIVLGFVARGRVKRAEATNGGMALTGAVLGLVAMVLSIGMIALVAAVWNGSGLGTYVSCVREAHNDKAEVTRCENDFKDRLEN